MLANPAKATIDIRLVYKGGPRWFKNLELDTIEQKRIERRFDTAIISKLELYTHSKAYKSDDGH